MHHGHNLGPPSVLRVCRPHSWHDTVTRRILRRPKGLVDRRPDRLRAVHDELVTRQELAEIMRVSVPTIDRMRRQGMPHVTWGRRLVRFRVQQAMSWAEEQRRAA